MVKTNERWSACVSWLLRNIASRHHFLKDHHFLHLSLCIESRLFCCFRMFLQQSFSLEQREATPLVNYKTPFGTMDPSLRPFRNRCFCLGRRWGCPVGSHVFCLGKKTGGLEDGVGGGWRKRSMSLKGNVGHLLQHWGAGNSYFLKVIRCNFDPSRTLEKIPAGRSKAFFRWAGIKTRVNFHDYIWITTNHCKDPY